MFIFFVDVNIDSMTACLLYLETTASELLCWFIHIHRSYIFLEFSLIILFKCISFQMYLLLFRRIAVRLLVGALEKNNDFNNKIIG